MTTNLSIVKFESALSARFRQIESVLPEGMDAARFCRMAINALHRQPALAECSPTSFALAVMTAAELGLEPSIGECALVPYKGKVTCQPMYQGLLKLARQSGHVSNVYAAVVREGDRFIYRLGTNRELEHEVMSKPGDKLLYVYAVARLQGSPEPEFVVLTAEEVEARRKVSKSAGKPDSPWALWPEEMWKKTGLRALCKILPKSTRQAMALIHDEDADLGRQARPLGLELAAEETVDPDPEPWDAQSEPEPEPEAGPTSEPPKNGDLL